jgi:transcriptional regulator with XRE-family HTH domain
VPPIGDSLREARMRQNLDIADVEERTKIRAKYLRALENEEFGLLPGPTAVRAFLRTYAQLLGLDPHVLLEEFRASHDTEEAEVQPFAEQAPAPPPRRPRPSAPIGPPPRGLVAGALVVALIAFLLILGLSAGSGDKNAKKTGTEQARTTPKRRPKPRKPKPPAGVALKISPTIPTYLCVDKGPGTQIVYQGTLSDPRTFKDAAKLRINMGKTSPTVEFNGKKLPIQQTGNPVGFEFSRTGSKPLAVGQRPCA